MNNKFSGISLISFLSSIAGVAISFLLLKQDVISTAHTVFEYFPQQFGVTPSTTWDGAVVLGLFVSVLEIVSASVAFSKKYSTNWRIIAGISFVVSLYFDNWTDVIFRSGWGTGDMKVAQITTLMFYTFGSELTQTLSWMILMSLWRPAISDIMWGLVRFGAGISSINSEWKQMKDKSNPQPKKEENRNSQQEQKKPQAPVAALDSNRYQRTQVFKIHKK